MVVPLGVGHARSLAVAGCGVATLVCSRRSPLLQIGLLELQAALDQLARQDGLTGVANRRQFDTVLQAEWNRARRSGTELALLPVAIDHSKAFHDQHGHPAGDPCLRAVAAVPPAPPARPAHRRAPHCRPGFPVLVPGQLVTAEILDFMSALDTREIHGYDPARGYRVLKSAVAHAA